MTVSIVVPVFNARRSMAQSIEITAAMQRGRGGTAQPARERRFRCGPA
jgi:hypothetical protein